LSELLFECMILQKESVKFENGKTEGSGLGGFRGQKVLLYLRVEGYFFSRRKARPTEAAKFSAKPPDGAHDKDVVDPEDLVMEDGSIEENEREMLLQE
jgi:hypothetical protein